jgi:hypothetical protein
MIKKQKRNQGRAEAQAQCTKRAANDSNDGSGSYGWKRLPSGKHDYVYNTSARWLGLNRFELWRCA